ncbi:MAG: hypothetical protein P8Y70_13400 [Candidatus Lokiarchaeota archaeon]
MSVKNQFEDVLNINPLDLKEFLDSSLEKGLSKFQRNLIEEATSILKENIVETESVKSFGGSIKGHEDLLDDHLQRIEKELEKDKYSENQKELKSLFKSYTKVIREYIDKTCFCIIPVKEMPWVDVLFRSVPRMIINDNIKLLDNSITYYGEIKCVLPRTILYGKMKEIEPLFAPLMGELDLKGYELDDQQKKSKKSLNFKYITEIIKSLDSVKSKNAIAKYHEGFQRHGDPLCDFLMQNGELMNSMNQLISGIDTGRLETEVAVSAIGIPFQSDKISLIIVENESNDSKAFSNCFEAILRFSAACCEAPNLGPIGTQETKDQTATGQQQQSGAIRTPGGQQLKIWSTEELIEEAQKKRSSLPEGMEVWSEEELKELSKKRASGLPEGLEMWTEDELKDLAKQRSHGGLDIPEWHPEEDSKECIKCGYTLREGWTECPICGTATDAGKNDKESTKDSEQISNEKEDSDQENETEKSKNSQNND